MKKIFILSIIMCSLQLVGKDNPAINIENAYIKNVPPVSPNSAAFMTIKNNSAVDINLIKVESDLSKVVELHNMILESGIMKMRQVDSILIKANSSTELKPGGLHIMLIGLKAPLKKDEKRIFTLTFDNGLTEKIEIQVKDVQLKAGEMEHDHNHGHHGHASHAMHNRADAVSPAGVMAPHMHEVGHWMIDYRYMGMNMYGLQDGKRSLNEYATLYHQYYDPAVQMPSGSLITGSSLGNIFPIMNPNSFRYMSVPTDMLMEMHMANIMTNLTENWMVMFMVPVVRNTMTMLSSNFDKAPMSSGGVGDVSFSAAYRFFHNENHAFFWGMGLVMPTGSIDEKDWMPMMGKQKVPYNMQPGTGTFSLQPQFSYNGNFKRLSWGTFTQAYLRMGKNDNHYRFGNRYEGTIWLSFLILDSWSVSIRVQKQRWMNLLGSDTSLDPKMDPQNDPFKQGGMRSDAFIGFNFFVTGGIFQGFRFGFEAGGPFHQSLNGPQLGTRQILNLFAQYSF